MKTRLRILVLSLIALTVHLSYAQEKTVSGTVTDQEGIPLPGVNVLLKGTNVGTQTDFDGNYSIQASPNSILIFSYVGQKTLEKTVGSATTINVKMEEDAQALDEVVVTALGIKESEKDLTYAAQKIANTTLTASNDGNLKSALAGKVAGVQIASQSGAKLGSSGATYLRGAVSLTGREEAIYVIDGIVSDANSIDPENIESISVLKGPNAAALYGLQASSGVIMITTKKGSKGAVRVNYNTSVTFDQVSYLPKFQNEYGQGSSGESDWRTWEQTSSSPSYFASMDGGYYNGSASVDESWGPKFDGREYYPWYSWMPSTDEVNNPYYAKTAKWSPNKNNIKDYFETGYTIRNSIDVSGGGENYRARVSYLNQSQNGILYNTNSTKNMFSGNFDVDLNDKLHVAITSMWTMTKDQGNMGDGSSGVFGNEYNNTTGSLNNWFGRDLDMSIMKELKDLKSPLGYYTSWNWQGPQVYSERYQGSESDLDYTKPYYWFNPYMQAEQEKTVSKYNRFVGGLTLDYKITDYLTATAEVQRSSYTYDYGHYIPYSMQFSSSTATGANDYVNSFDEKYIQQFEHYIKPSINFDKYIIDNTLKLNTTVGYIFRNYQYKGLGINMSNSGNYRTEDVGLVIPDLYILSNSRERVNATKYDYHFTTNSLFSRINLDYKSFLILNIDLRNDWDSRYDVAGEKNSNSFLYGSAGLNFIFSKVFDLPEYFSFGKFFVNYAEIGTEISASNPYMLNPGYSLSDQTYNGNQLMYASTSATASGITPATSTSIEVGTDLEFFKKRLRLNATYYYENRSDEILPSTTLSSTGVSEYVANGGLVNRQGLELVLGGKPIQSKDFIWDVNFNIAFNKTIAKELVGAPYTLASNSARGVYVMNYEGEEWGQLVASTIQRNDDGVPILSSSGMYTTEDNHRYGSVLPKYTGGFINTFSYKNFTLQTNLTFQKGGKFLSGSEITGIYTGLLDETVGNNDKGNPIRDAVADGGGVHVQGIDTNGDTIDTYVAGKTYWRQFRSNDFYEIGTGVHDASYIKLNEINFSYQFPKAFLGNYLSDLRLSLFARNVALLSVSKDNHHRWDPSEMSQLWGEYYQLPGVRTFGFNLKASF